MLKVISTIDLDKIMISFKSQHNISTIEKKKKKSPLTNSNI